MKKNCGPGMGDMAWRSEKKGKKGKAKKAKKKADVELAAKEAYFKEKGLKFE